MINNNHFVFNFSNNTCAIFPDMNCNLRSTKYINDGQCVSTKPIVEAVCADRCLVSANSLSQRHRSSLLHNQQVCMGVDWS